MFDLLREIGQTLKHNKLRTALTGIAVSWGIFMLIVLLGMSHGVLNAFNSSFMNTGTDQINLFGGQTSKAYAGYKEGRRIKMRDDDGQYIKSNDPTHIADYAYVISNGTAVVSTTKDYSTGYAGVSPSHAKNFNITMSQGRFINDADMDNIRKVAVISRDNAAMLFGPDSTTYIGSRVSIGGFSFVVVGVYNHEWESTTFIPFRTAKKLNGDSPEIERISVKVQNLSSVPDGEEAEKEIRKAMGQKHEFAADDESAVWIWNRFTQHLKSVDGLGLLELAVWIIGILTMLSGIVGVSNIMFVSVKERTHEIGIRRAIGAKPRNILTQVISESVIITAIFGYIGIVLGVLVCSALSVVFASSPGIKNPGVDIAVALDVTIVLVIAGALAGLFPAMKALKIKPVEALRDE